MPESVASSGDTGSWISRYVEGVCGEMLTMAEEELRLHHKLSAAMEALLYELRQNYNDVLDFEFQQAREGVGEEIDDFDVAEGNAELFTRFKVVLNELPPPPPTRGFGQIDRRVCRVGEGHIGFRGR